MVTLTTLTAFSTLMDMYQLIDDIAKQLATVNSTPFTSDGPTKAGELNRQISTTESENDGFLVTVTPEIWTADRLAPFGVPRERLAQGDHTEHVKLLDAYRQWCQEVGRSPS